MGNQRHCENRDCINPTMTCSACWTWMKERMERIEKRMALLTGRQARLICDAHIDDILGEPEAEEALALSNPKLLEAYYALHRYSVGSHTATRGADQDKTGQDAG